MGAAGGREGQLVRSALRIGARPLPVRRDRGEGHPQALRGELAMRRILAAALAALLMLPAVVGARTAVIVVPNSTELGPASAVYRSDGQTARQRTFQYITSFLNANTVPDSYDVIPARQVQTGLIRFGRVTGWNNNLPYTAVIWNGLVSTVALNMNPGCYPCSLSITGM